MQHNLKYRYNNVHKRGMSELGSTLITLLLVGLVIWGTIVLYGKWSSGGKQLLQCTAQEGVCTAGTCDWRTQVPILSGKISGCKDKELCCVERNKGQQVDPMCMDAEGNDPLPFGTECGDNMLCDAAQVCVDRCTFCSTNVGNTEVATYAATVNKECGFSDNAESDAIKKVFEKGGMFSCSCNQEQCDANREVCVYSPAGMDVYYCGVDTADYCCAYSSLKNS